MLHKTFALASLLIFVSCTSIFQHTEQPESVAPPSDITNEKPVNEISVQPRKLAYHEARKLCIDGKKQKHETIKACIKRLIKESSSYKQEEASPASKNN